MAQCHAKTRQGTQCKNGAVRSKLCALHPGLQQAKPSRLREHREALKSGAEIAAGIAALLELIKAAVEVWGMKPFGHGVGESTDLNRHKEELLPGFQYPRMLLATLFHSQESPTPTFSGLAFQFC